MSKTLSTSLSDGSMVNSSSCRKNFVGDVVNGSCYKFRFYSIAETRALLNGTTVYFVGDSITRRVLYELNSYLKSVTFRDDVAHNDVTIFLHNGSFSCALHFYWRPIL